MTSKTASYNIKFHNNILTHFHAVILMKSETFETEEKLVENDSSVAGHGGEDYG